MHAEITELLPVTTGKLMLQGRRVKSGNTSICLCHLWVRLLFTAGGTHTQSQTHTHTHTHAHMSIWQDLRESACRSSSRVQWV